MVKASLGKGRNQLSGRVSVFVWHATPVANAAWKQLGMKDPNYYLALYTLRENGDRH